jgi:transcription antitermination protein NusB
MAKRSKAREVVLQVLYQDDVNAGGEPPDREEFLRSRLYDDSALMEFARSLINGVRRNRTELDALLSKTADNWSLERMAATDRNVLRMGTYEILHTETPPPVVINEAVELARRFGSAQSAQFVNGILDKFVAGHEKKSDN